MIVGNGDFRYERVDGWAKLPEYFDLNDPVDIAVDSRDRVYVGSRGNHPILIFNPDGSFVSCWGEGYFFDPHGLYVGSDDTLYIADSRTHVVEKRTLGGELLMTIGTRFRAMPIMLRAPFNQPTGVVLGPEGDLYVTDGYGNFLVHKFSPDGKLLKTWGEHGKSGGQFELPHKLDIDDQGQLYICDRNNDRVQIFNLEGEFVGMWTDCHWPQDISIDRKNGLAYLVESHMHGTFKPRVTVRDLQGNTLSEFGGYEHEGQGVLENSHTICVDSHGDIYIGDIVKVKRLMKFARVT
jgi:DNA-binding beta-propeller fold protein YncE